MEQTHLNKMEEKMFTDMVQFNQHGIVPTDVKPIERAGGNGEKYLISFDPERAKRLREECGYGKK